MGLRTGLLCCFAFLAGCMVSQLEVARYISPQQPRGKHCPRSRCLPMHAGRGFGFRRGALP